MKFSSFFIFVIFVTQGLSAEENLPKLTKFFTKCTVKRLDQSGERSAACKDAEINAKKLAKERCLYDGGIAAECESLIFNVKKQPAVGRRGEAPWSCYVEVVSNKQNAANEVRLMPHAGGNAFQYVPVESVSSCLAEPYSTKTPTEFVANYKYEENWVNRFTYISNGTNLVTVRLEPKNYSEHSKMVYRTSSFHSARYSTADEAVKACEVSRKNFIDRMSDLNSKEISVKDDALIFDRREFKTEEGREADCSFNPPGLVLSNSDFYVGR